MSEWKIDAGPRRYDSRGTADIDVGWAYDIERNGERRTISVEVAGGRSGSDELPDDARRAIRTSGRSAVESVLGEDDPPRYLLVGSLGVRPRVDE